MTDHALNQLCQEVFSDIFPEKQVKIEASFYPSRSLKHSVKFQDGKIKIRIAETLRSAPEIIIKTLCTILFLKLFRFKIDRRLYRHYREYLEKNAHLIQPAKKRPPSPRYNSVGIYFNLDKIFDRLNHAFFENRLQKPVLGWSLKKSYRRLGFYSGEKNLLVISRIFDSKKVPESVVEYLMYHEMLHIDLPAVKVNHRRRIHGAEFKIRERLYPHYNEVQKWLKKNLKRL